MWKDSEGNYGPLAYVLLGVVVVAVIVMFVLLLGTPQADVPFQAPKTGAGG